MPEGPSQQRTLTLASPPWPRSTVHLPIWTQQKESSQTPEMELLLVPRRMTLAKASSQRVQSLGQSSEEVAPLEA